MAKNYADLDAQDIKQIRDSLDLLIQSIADKNDMCPESVATVVFYRIQRHPNWGRNASSIHKNASYKYWNGICHRCKEQVERVEAKFHHLTRGVPQQHGPLNLVPEHTSCHDDEHNVIYGSLSKGSRTSKKRRNP